MTQTIVKWFAIPLRDHRKPSLGGQWAWLLSLGNPLSVRVLANSNVLILSLGNAPMVLQLSFPGGSARDAVGEKSTYVVHPLFSVPCSFGTLFVFSPTDDLFYYPLPLMPQCRCRMRSTLTLPLSF